MSFMLNVSAQKFRQKPTEEQNLKQLFLLAMKIIFVLCPLFSAHIIILIVRRPQLSESP